MVGRDARRLDRANSQLYGAETTGQRFLGPPLGGLLFTLGAFVPFLGDAVSFAASSALIASIRGHFRPEHALRGASARLRPTSPKVCAGCSRTGCCTLAVVLALINLVAMACDAVLVLFAQEKLRLGGVGLGLLLTVSAAGGLAGSVVAPGCGHRSCSPPAYGWWSACWCCRCSATAPSRRPASRRRRPVRPATPDRPGLPYEPRSR